MPAVDSLRSLGLARFALRSGSFHTLRRFLGSASDDDAPRDDDGGGQRSLQGRASLRHDEVRESFDLPLRIEDLEVMYRRHAHAVLSRCRQLLQDEPAAWDAMHDTFTKAIRYRRSYRGDAEPVRWLFGIAYKVCMTWLKRRRSTFLIPTEPGALESLMLEDAQPESFETHLMQQRVVAGLLSRLSPKHQEVAVLRYFDGMSVAEIAGHTRTSERTIARRLAEMLSRAEKILTRGRT